MTIDLTREEWLEARERVADAAPLVDLSPGELDSLTEAALGCPCPPEPPPEPFRKGDYKLVWTVEIKPSRYAQEVAESLGRALTEGVSAESMVTPAWWVGIPGSTLTPAEADAMAAALIEHAAYARKQEETP